MVCSIIILYIVMLLISIPHHTFHGFLVFYFCGEDNDTLWHTPD